MVKNNIESKEIRTFVRLIEIINSFRETFENITTMPLYGSHTIPMPIENDLIKYQELRRDIIRENIPLNIEKYDNLVAQATIKLNQTPLCTFSSLI